MENDRELDIKSALLAEQGMQPGAAFALAQRLSLRATRYICEDAQYQRVVSRVTEAGHEFDSSSYLDSILVYVLPDCMKAIRWINAIPTLKRAACLTFIERELHDEHPSLNAGDIGWTFQFTFRVVGIWRTHRPNAQLNERGMRSLEKLLEIEREQGPEVQSAEVQFPTELFSDEALDSRLYGTWE